MKSKFSIVCLFMAFSALLLTGCGKGKDGINGTDGQDGINGTNGQNATVYYSEWFSPSAWTSTGAEWYFDASAPDLTQDIVENGVVLAYVWLSGDVYDATAVRPLPAVALGANWSFLIHQYGSIQFTTDYSGTPGTLNKFRFIAIPGTISAAKSASVNGNDLKKMSYKDVCKLYNIPE